MDGRRRLGFTVKQNRPLPKQWLCRKRILPDCLYSQLCALEIFQKISQSHLTEGSDPASVHLVFLVSKLLPLCSRQRLQARRIRDLCPCKGNKTLLNRAQLFFLRKGYSVVFIGNAGRHASNDRHSTWQCIVRGIWRGKRNAHPGSS